jgi:predicted molibdopterin-dependent oxidoreductase YjgC
MYTTTESSRVADLVLPAAGWGEKEGTFINSERRIGVVRKVARAPGDALADFAIFRLVAEAWGCGGLFREWTTPEAVFGLLRRLSEGRPCDFSGVTDYRMIERAGGIQWPYTKEDAEAGPPETHRRLFEDSRFFTASGKAQFVFAVPREAGEKPDSAYPYIMLTGRGSSAQWHTGTRTGKSKVLAKLMPGEPYVEMHPDDAAGLGVEPGVKVEVASRRGRLMARAYLTPTVQRGHVFVPMHDVQVNRLTYPDFDAHSRQPSFKYCAVQVRVCERQDQA